MFEIADVGLLTAFAAGVVSFLSPCVLPLVPGYLSFVAGRSVDELQALDTRRERLAVLTLSANFMLGFATVFIILGAGASLLGRWLLAYKTEAGIVGGVIVIVFGLFMTGLLNLRWLHLDLRFVHRIRRETGALGAYLLGLAFAFGWTPCIGPILGAILTVSASSAGAASGVALLAIYSLGLGVPFLLTALFMNHFLAHMKRLRRWGRPLHIGGGVIMILMGVAMITGQLTVFSYWLLDVFPWLGRIG
ncbi:MAG: cytochrome C biogenesis protein [Maritimibacter sp.]|nr:cytochrome C biogenesis protein [Maritimibacter sp.]|tara:strand:- start:794 stop:1537 length:744 start_codon:yes stop_codon:yes gene_type:complete